MKRIYCAIGKLVEVTQNIELNIIEIIEKSEIIKEFGRHAKITIDQYNQVVDDANYLKNKMETMTFGQMISIVYESESLKNDEINQLKVLLEKRNYFTHEYFKITHFPPNNEEFILEENLEYEECEILLSNYNDSSKNIEKINLRPYEAIVIKG